MAVPPGILFLIPVLPRVIAPPFLVYVLLWVCEQTLGYLAPFWLSVIAYVGSWPLALAAIVYSRNFRNWRKARSLGAVMPPVVDYAWPGNPEMVIKTMRADGSKIIGQSIVPAHLSRQC